MRTRRGNEIKVMTLRLLGVLNTWVLDGIEKVIIDTKI